MPARFDRWDQIPRALIVRILLPVIFLIAPEDYAIRCGVINHRGPRSWLMMKDCGRVVEMNSPTCEEVHAENGRARRDSWRYTALFYFGIETSCRQLCRLGCKFEENVTYTGRTTYTLGATTILKLGTNIIPKLRIWEAINVNSGSMNVYKFVIVELAVKIFNQSKLDWNKATLCALHSLM